jgi:hypothetical protein
MSIMSPNFREDGMSRMTYTGIALSALLLTSAAMAADSNDQRKADSPPGGSSSSATTMMPKITPATTLGTGAPGALPAKTVDSNRKPGEPQGHHD